MAKSRMKVRHFLREYMDHIAIRKLHRNEPLTSTDLGELERIFIKAGLGKPTENALVRERGGLGLFIRSLIGLDRASAKKAFETFLTDKTLSADQMEFVSMVVDHLTEQGVMDPALLYESPFTDLNALGVDGVLGKAKSAEVIAILRNVRERAAAERSRSYGPHAPTPCPCK